MGNAAEIVGKVQNDLSIRAYQATDFGSSIGRFALVYSGYSRCSRLMPAYRL